jgi:hypothetical protein
MLARLQYKEHVYYITSNNPQSAYNIHIVHNAHEYGPMEITMTLLHPAQKSKHINTLENCYVHYFHHQDALQPLQQQRHLSSTLQNMNSIIHVLKLKYSL